MKRYRITIVDDHEDPEGEWVRYGSALSYAESQKEAGRREEREEIIGALEKQKGLEHPEEYSITESTRLCRMGRKMGLTLAIERIRSRGEASKPPENLGREIEEEYNRMHPPEPDPRDEELARLRGTLLGYERDHAKQFKPLDCQCALCKLARAAIRPAQEGGKP